MIRVTVNNRGVQAIPLSPVTVGAEGIVAAFLFSDDWAGLAKTAIFKGSGEEVEKIVLNNQCTVPPEVLTEAGGMLQVGVYGNDGLGTLIRPTIWGVVGRIEDSAISEDAGQTGTTPSWAAQVQNAVQEALIVAQGVRTDADAGEFDGATFTPSVAADGTLSWTNDKEKENPQPVNIKGPQGPQGNPGTSGQDGVTPDFQIGSVETLNPGQSATATITGTPAKPVLNLGIPQGQKGDSGGGSGTSDYTQLSNKPQINGHTLSGNQIAADLGLGTYNKPADGIPKTDLAQDVQQSLRKAETALQSAPVQSVAGKTGAVTLGAGDVGYDSTETYQAGTVGAELSNQSRQLSDTKNAISQKAPIIINTASGDIASFSDGADGMQIRKIVGTIETATGGSGWTEAKITVEGKNLFNKNSVRRGYYIGQGGGPVSNANFGYTFVHVYGLSSIRVSGNKAENSAARCCCYDFNGTVLKSSDYKSNKTITLPSGTWKVAITVYIAGASKDIDTVQVEAGSVATQYEAYNGQELPISWETEAGTITNGTIIINDDLSADVTNIDTGNTYHLTNVGSLDTLYGYNHLWIDTGVITSCNYPADTKLYIDGLTAPGEDMIANANIASGKYFVVNNQLYLSTAAIAAGASIIPGTNCTTTNIAAALNAINT